MDPRFEDLFTPPENEIFRVVFFPDRIYHARYLNATRSSRYRYNVTEVRSGPETTVMKGEVHLNGTRLCGMLRIEYTGLRLVEQAREVGRRLGPTLKAWVRAIPQNAPPGETLVTLHWDPIISAYAVEIWETLETPLGTTHDYRVLNIMGRDAPITRASELAPALGDLKGLRQLAVAFREQDTLYPTGQAIGNVQWDNAYLRSHQEPRSPVPSAPENTVRDDNYLLDFQRGFFIPDAGKVEPVRYRNAMMNDGDPERREENIIQMRWLLQREFGGHLIFFHEVTIPPGTIEGAHRHIGSEELYYVIAGQGLAYMKDGDDPATGNYPLVERQLYGLDPVMCRELPVQAGSVIYTKSGGVHGIRNSGIDPLRFVAFLYHTL
ncbi:cupin [Kocuria rosea subsp. polaris]|uniref:Cupin n=1 Tax=Kocuria rosea subsp. polaris TaxID=136273 RepID=A0A0W8I6L8_KOCRO|nr:cupin domain-containing protein [Kocuria polaris]KUG53871.1 cupin [Kocuria polaris]